jgi:putative acetyltransferase
MVTIRHEKPEDRQAIRTVLRQAFDSSEESGLVDALRKRGAITLSLVALEKEVLVGHILFSPVTIDSGPSSSRVLGLGPMAVLPDHQRKGIGSRLTRVGLEECGRLGHEIVVVLGYPAFYTRFGFSPASLHDIKCEFDVPDDVFMVMELREGALSKTSGTAKYQPEFGSV